MRSSSVWIIHRFQTFPNEKQDRKNATRDVHFDTRRIGLAHFADVEADKPGELLRQISLYGLCCLDPI